MVMGEVMQVGYIFTGHYFGNEVQGRGYIEYIDIEILKPLKMNNLTQE